jgi:hypothetical protein
MSFYVGVSSTSRIVFRSAVTPTTDSLVAKIDPDAYQYVIGPFRTRGAAELMKRYGMGNPHLRSVSLCEHYNRQLPTKWYRMEGYEPNQYLNAMQPIAGR